MEEYLSTNDVAKRLGVARETVLYYERRGKLSPIRTVGGIRLFLKSQVEELAERRAAGIKGLTS